MRVAASQLNAIRKHTQVLLKQVGGVLNLALRHGVLTFVQILPLLSYM